LNKILDGKKLSLILQEDLKEKINKLSNSPNLTVVMVGEDKASKIYVKNKEKIAKKMGIDTNTIYLNSETTTDELLSIIERLNKDKSVNGILVQLPLPKHIDENLVLEKISPLKDVDGFHPKNLGKLMINNASMIPCTPLGIIKLLDFYNIDLEGKNVVILGRSNIVGKPMLHLLLQKNATVTITHSYTKNLKDITKKADILIVAIGKSNFITKEYIKDNAIIVDVGINRVDNKIMGDVDFNSVKDKVSFITPVPGGVGPLTITMLMYQTYIAYLNQNKEKR
jgi:bifunctional protein folD